MNYISHHEVARQYDPDASADFLFGAIISDLARMSGTRRILTQLTNPELIAGITLHNLTNKPAFDGQPAIKRLEEDMRASFDAFLPWQSARQASRAGKDLLFDGIQFGVPRIVDDLLLTLGRTQDGEVSFSGADETAPLLELVERIRRHGPPRYDDVEVVGRRLFATLDKTRTRLDPKVFDQVIEVFEVHQPTVFAIGPLAMRQTVESLQAMDLPF